MVYRASLVALDLPESGNCNRNDGVRLLRDSAAGCHGYTSHQQKILGRHPGGENETVGGCQRVRLRSHLLTQDVIRIRGKANEA
jgi:hypothetical protein